MQPFNYSSSYEEFLARMRKSLRDQDIRKDISTRLNSGFEKAMNEQNIVLSRGERQRAFQILSKEILAELMEGLDKS